MNRWTSKFRSVLYPMVGVILVVSLWTLASQKAQNDRFDYSWSRPLPPLDSNKFAADHFRAPVGRADLDAR